MLSRNEQIKIDNYKEQYNSILRNISDANKQLEVALYRTAEAEESLNKIQISMIGGGKELAVLLNTAIEVEDATNRNRELLNKREESVSIKEKDFKTRESNIIKSIEEYSSKYDYSIIIGNKELLKQNQEIENKLNIKHRLSLEVESLESKESLIKKASNTLSKVIVDKLKEIKLLETDFENKNNALTQALKEAKEEVKKEKEKVDEPMKGLAQRKKDVVLRERDAQIIVNRLRNIYKEQLPHVTFKL